MKPNVNRASTWRFGTLGAKARYPGRLLRYAGMKAAYRLGLIRAPFLPVTLDIEPNNTCNFRCPHCQVPHWTKRPAYLDEAGLSKILGQAPDLVRIKLQGMGEPLLNRHLVGMLQMGEARGVLMSFFSNGALCTDAIAGELARLKDTEITFSLDGASKEVFEKIRAGGTFEKVVSNIRFLTRLRGAARTPRVFGWTLVTSENIHELAGIVRLSRELGLDRLTVQTFLSDWGKESMKPHTDALKVGQDSSPLRAAIEEARNVARAIGLDLRISYHDYYSRKRKCVWPWTGAYIAANGDVVPCCIIADSDTVKMGNVFERDFAAIWNSRAYRDLRRRIRNHDLPEFCRNCYIDAG